MKILKMQCDEVAPRHVNEEGAKVSRWNLQTSQWGIRFRPTFASPSFWESRPHPLDDEGFCRLAWQVALLQDFLWHVCKQGPLGFVLSDGLQQNATKVGRWQDLSSFMAAAMWWPADRFFNKFNPFVGRLIELHFLLLPLSVSTCESANERVCGLRGFNLQLAGSRVWRGPGETPEALRWSIAVSIPDFR